MLSISTSSGFKFSSLFDSFEFSVVLDSTALCFLFKCLFMFRFALNTSLHSGHFTFSWSSDLGFCWHAPTKHIQRPGLSSVLCILLLWSFMYTFKLVLYLHSWESVQESAWFPVGFNAWLCKCWSSRSLVWKSFPQSGQAICFPICIWWTIFLCRFKEVIAMSLLQTSHLLICIILIVAEP